MTVCITNAQEPVSLSVPGLSMTAFILQVSFERPDHTLWLIDWSAARGINWWLKRFSARVISARAIWGEPRGNQIISHVHRERSLRRTKPSITTAREQANKEERHPCRQWSREIPNKTKECSSLSNIELEDTRRKLKGWTIAFGIKFSLEGTTGRMGEKERETVIERGRVCIYERGQGKIVVALTLCWLWILCWWWPHDFYRLCVWPQAGRAVMRCLHIHVHWGLLGKGGLPLVYPSQLFPLGELCVSTFIYNKFLCVIMCKMFTWRLKFSFRRCLIR